MREELEAHLVANPDDVAGHAAYADYLIEQGDPRGEFIRVQLALEDETLSKDDRDVLRSREKELLAAHERDWLGDLAVPLLGQPPPPPTPEAKTWLGRVVNWVSQMKQPHAPLLNFQIRRGWLHRLEVFEPQASKFWYDLSKCSIARLLSEIMLHVDEGLAGTFANVTTFQLGEEELSTVFAGGAELCFENRFPRLEELRLYVRFLPARSLFELHSLPHLRRLTYWHDYHYPLHLLAANSSFSQLEYLSCFPHFYDPREDAQSCGSYLPLEEVAPLFRSPHLMKLTHLALRESNMGDEGVQILVESGMLARLRVLDLSHGAITDGGANLLARQGQHLESLNLSDNALSPAGVRALQDANVPVIATEQHAVGDDSYLYTGEFE